MIRGLLNFFFFLILAKRALSIASCLGLQWKLPSFLVNIKIEVMFQHATLQHLLGTWAPERNPDPSIGALDPSSMQRMSKGAQNGIFSSPCAWQEPGHILMLVSRKYQEALPFLFHFYYSFTGLWWGFFYWILTWGRSMRDSLQTTQESRADADCAWLCLHVLSQCTSMCSTALHLMQSACNSRAWMELFMQEFCAHSWEISYVIPREAKMLHVGSWCLHSSDVTSKCNAEIILLGGCRIPSGVWGL